VTPTASWQERYADRFYHSQPGWKDGTTEFYDLCSGAIRSGSEILDVGAGPTNQVTRHLATLGSVTGLDVDEAVHGNESCVATRTYDGKQFPFEDNLFHGVVANYVLEHVEFPELFAGEVFRVLRPGGVFVFRCPNLWNYVSLIARLTPHWFHELVANKVRDLPDDHSAPYPTFHRLNTMRRCRKVLAAAGFEIVEMRSIEKQPSYGRFSRIAYLILMGYERVVNSSQLFEPLRSNIFCVVRRPGGP